MSEELSLAERAAIERNRQKALLKLERKRKQLSISDLELEGNGSAFIDSNAGFLLNNEIRMKIQSNIAKKHDDSSNNEEKSCDLCSNIFFSSYLWNNFDLKVCNKCRDPISHKLINKTSAKDVYLLNDNDLNKRKPPLKYVMKPNPKNTSWGDMKLYLEAQVAERSLEIWGTEEALEEERRKRLENVDKMKILKYQKNIKKMREDGKAVEIKFDGRGHEHCYSSEVEEDEEENMFRRTCCDCGYVDRYEVM